MKMKPEKVLSIRERLALTQTELAKKLGVGLRTYQRWEKRGAPMVAANLLLRMEEDHNRDLKRATSREHIDKLRSV